jgi:predicted O-methyltransferase YrrM
MIPLQLPTDYDIVEPGLDSIKFESPWMTPNSVDFLVKNLKANMNVLEIGAGGSTLFFSRRCRHVTAIELDRQYYDILRKNISEKNLQNKISLEYIPPENVMSRLESLNSRFDVISIDHGVHVPSRSECFNKVVHLWTGKILVIDNWAKRPAWPQHKGKTLEWYKDNYSCFENCDLLDFPHEKWIGKGTRIIVDRGLLF